MRKGKELSHESFVPSGNKQSTIVTIIMITCLLISSGSLGFFGYAYALPSTVTTIIEEGTAVETASYTIWRAGSTYYAKNGSTGEIEFDGANLTTVSQNAIDSVTGDARGLIFYKAGEYRVPAAIQMKDGVDIKGAGILATRFDNDNPVAAYASAVFNWIGGTIYRGFKISDLSITGYGTDAPLINIQGGGTISDVRLDNLWLHNAGDDAGSSTYSDGIHFVNVYSSTITNCLIENNEQYGADINSCNAIRITGTRFLNNQIGLRIITNVQTTLRDSTVENNNNIGLYIWGSRQTEVNEVYFENNVNQHLRLISGYAPADDNVITNNYFNGMPIGIYMDSTSPYYVSRTEIRHNWFNGQTDKGIEINDVNVTHTRIEYNYFIACLADVSDSGTGTRFIEDDATGSDSGTTPITVTHGLSSTPTRIVVTPTTDAGDFYVDTLTATQFNIAWDGGGTVTFYWYAEC